MNNLPANWELKKLGKIITALENGNRPKGGVNQISAGIPSIGGEHLNSKGGFDFENIRYIQKEFYDSMNRGKIKKKDILIVKDGATTGKVSFVNDDFPYEECAVNEHVFIVRADTNKVVPKYLFYILFSNLGQSQIMKTFHGSAIGGINSKFVDSVSIPLFPLPIQRKIVSILERAEKLKNLRQEANDETNTIIQALFYEMFGDPVKNEKRWQTASLIDHLEILGGFAFKSKDFVSGGIPLIKIGTVNKGYFDTSGISFLPYQYLTEYNKYTVSYGDILISLTGTIGKDDYGNICVCDDKTNKYLLNQRVAKLIPKKTLNSKYLMFVFKNRDIKYKLTKLSRGIRQANISNKDILSVVMSIPPISLQNQFASLVEKIESIKENQTQSTEEINTLFDALMQKAFQGELIA